MNVFEAGVPSFAALVARTALAGMKPATPEVTLQLTREAVAQELCIPVKWLDNDEGYEPIRSVIDTVIAEAVA